MNDEVFSRLIAPVTRGIRLLFGRGVLTGTHDELKMQNVQLTGMDGETFDDVERPQQYGQISVPLPGAETFFAGLHGGRKQKTGRLRAGYAMQARSTKRHLDCAGA